MTSLQYYPDLVTLDYVRQMRELSATETGDDEILKDLIHGTSADVIRLLQRVPMPYLATKTFDYSRESIWRHDMLYVDDDLLAVTTLTNAGDTIAASDYVLRPANEYPKEFIRLKTTSSDWTYDTEMEDATSIVGEWGYVPHYGRHWIDSGIDVPGGGLTAAATSVTVSDSSGFETLQYLRINSEFIQVTANNTSTNTLTLSRGELGTTAAAHTAGDDIETYHQLQDIKHGVGKIVGYLYKTLHDVGGELKVYEGGTVTVERLDPSIYRSLRDNHRKQRPFIV